MCTNLKISQSHKLVALRDRQIFFRKSKIFLPPNFFETSEPEESTGKIFFENSYFLLLKNRLLYF